MLFNWNTVRREALEMISYVSASDNGDAVPERAKLNPEFLWVRYADRLEAIGTIGAVRTYQYNAEANRPLAVASTPLPKTEAMVW